MSEILTEAAAVGPGISAEPLASFFDKTWRISEVRRLGSGCAPGSLLLTVC